jgi:hypothetical protein
VISSGKVALILEPPGGARRLNRVILGARFGVLIVLMELMVACGSSQQPASGSQVSLVVGTVTAGPVTPVQRVGRPNSRPLPGASVEALRGGDVVAAARSDDRGRYRLTIRPGTYLIRARPPGRFLSKQEPVKTVTVSAGETLTIDFSFDTGIR